MQLPESIQHLLTPRESGHSRFLDLAKKGRSFDLDSKLEALYKAMGADRRFVHAEPEEVIKAVRSMVQKGGLKLEQASLLNSLSHQLGSDAINELWRDAASPIFDQVKKTHASAVERPSSMQKAYQKWNALSADHQMNAGMFGIAALLGAFGCIRNAKNSVHKDHDGATHFVWSNAGIAILQGALAIGCGCLAAQALRGGRAH